MIAHELQESFRQLPAGPFTVHISEKTPIVVAHSDFASIAPGGGMLTAWDSEGYFHFIDALSITRINIPSPASSMAG